MRIINTFKNKLSKKKKLAILSNFRPYSDRQRMLHQPTPLSNRRRTFRSLHGPALLSGAVRKHTFTALHFEKSCALQHCHSSDLSGFLSDRQRFCLCGYGKFSLAPSLLWQIKTVKRAADNLRNTRLFSHRLFEKLIVSSIWRTTCAAYRYAGTIACSFVRISIL